VDAPTTGRRSETWTKQAYALVRQDILSGRLPPGSKLKVERLKELYGIGPTPLRESLSRLSSEGLVVAEQLRGFRVAPVSRKELQELSELRVMLETEALRSSIAIGDADWEGQIAAAFHKLDRLERRVNQGEVPNPDEWEDRNREFHDSLVAAADSKWLLRLRTQLFDLTERYRRYGREVLAANHSDRLSVEHRAMMEAALDRNAEEAVRLMTGHILSNVKLLADCIEH
jgi:GntR family carbon starvation induced transcriptional regulator